MEWALRYAGAALAGDADTLLPRRHDPIPTIAEDGRVVLLSPELAGFASPRVRRLHLRLGARDPAGRDRAGGRRAPAGWIAEYLSGVEACRGGLCLLRVLRRRPCGEPVLRARPVRRHPDPALPQQQDLPTGRSSRPCPSSLTATVAGANLTERLRGDARPGGAGGRGGGHLAGPGGGGRHRRDRPSRAGAPSRTRSRRSTSSPTGPGRPAASPPTRSSASGCPRSDPRGGRRECGRQRRRRPRRRRPSSSRSPGRRRRRRVVRRRLVVRRRRRMASRPVPPSSRCNAARSVLGEWYFNSRATFVCLALARPRPMARPPRTEIAGQP